jgi:hypothetical protein
MMQMHNAWITNLSTGINTYTLQANGSSYSTTTGTPPITIIKPAEGFMVAANGTGDKIILI